MLYTPKPQTVHSCASHCTHGLNPSPPLHTLATPEPLLRTLATPESLTAPPSTPDPVPAHTVHSRVTHCTRFLLSLDTLATPQPLSGHVICSGPFAGRNGYFGAPGFVHSLSRNWLLSSLSLHTLEPLVAHTGYSETPHCTHWLLWGPTLAVKEPRAAHTG
ncbi:hypothetical protein NDU88_000723 [Pleurodeles waltl]|uniref:Uncharacterized protein n=1 Tax=Pleurodeles waltl TaxID=8319 RepID=A0AAV7MHM9_PLEWA|nr:hypothetical protein NDU88_000723 [Pleurodeles waltl]